MSRRMMIVVGLALLALFLLVMWLNGRRAPRFPTVNLEAPSLAQARQRLTRRLQASDLRLAGGGQDGCQRAGSRLVAPEGAACVFTIPANADFTRQARLTLAAGQGVEVTLRQPNALSVQESLAPGDDPLELDVFRNADDQGAVLTLQGCTGTRPTETPEGEVLVCEVELLR